MTELASALASGIVCYLLGVYVASGQEAKGLRARMRSLAEATGKISSKTLSRLVAMSRRK